MIYNGGISLNIFPVDDEPSVQILALGIRNGVRSSPDIVCDNVTSMDEFPEDFFTSKQNPIWNFKWPKYLKSIILFTDEQRLNGAIVLHILAAIYFFTLLAVVCNDYFLPSVECICDDLLIPKVHIHCHAIFLKLNENNRIFP